MLAQNNSLRCLKLDNNNLHQKDFNSFSVALKQCMKKNKTLQTLSLNNCDLTNSELIPLFKGLSQNRHVVNLMLSNNGIDNTGV